MKPADDTGWRASFIARHRRVLSGYQEILDNGPIPANERDAIVERMRRIAKEIRDVQNQLDDTAIAA
jgi:hypothetical protein